VSIICRHPTCSAKLTDPVSVARGYGPKHDPDPDARRALKRSTARRTATPAAPKTDMDGQCDLMDVLEQGES
jgi:hypothetical protein